MVAHDLEKLSPAGLKLSVDIRLLNLCLFFPCLGCVGVVDLCVVMHYVGLVHILCGCFSFSNDSSCLGLKNKIKLPSRNSCNHELVALFPITYEGILFF